MKKISFFLEDQEYFAKIEKERQTEHTQEISRLNFMIDSNMYPDKNYFYRQKGIHLSCLEKHKQAIQYFDKAIQYNNKDAESFYQKGNIYRHFLKDSKKAIQELDQAIKINPYHTQAIQTKGFALMDLQRNIEALQAFNEIIRINKFKDNGFGVIYNYFNPFNLDPRGLKVMALQKLGKWSDVLKCYDELIEKCPNSQHNHHGRAKALLQLNRSNQALLSIEKALNKQPDNQFFLCTKGRILATLGDKYQVQQFYNKLIKSQIEINKDPSFFYLQLAKAMEIMGDKRGALRNYDLALQLSPNYYQVYYYKGMFFYSIGQNEKALECFKKSTQINPEYAEGYKGQKAIFGKRNQYWEAIKCCNKLIQLNPNNSWSYNNKAWYLSKLGDHQLALYCINIALQINPSEANIHHSKGYALAGLGRHKEAIQFFDRAIQLDPHLIEAHVDKGKSYLALKKYVSANNSFKWALAICYHHAEALKGRQQALKFINQNDSSSSSDNESESDVEDRIWMMARKKH